MQGRTIEVLYIDKLGEQAGDALFLSSHRARDYALLAEVGNTCGFRVVVGFLKNLDGRLLRDVFVYRAGIWTKIKSVEIDFIFDRSVSDDRTTPSRHRIADGVGRNLGLPFIRVVAGQAIEKTRKAGAADANRGSGKIRAPAWEGWEGRGSEVSWGGTKD